MIKIYDIECEDCKRVFESFVEDNNFPTCPVCGGDTHRVFTTMNFKLIYNNKKDVCA
jgi:putative FmdB family regulatory protein